MGLFGPLNVMEAREDNRALRTEADRQARSFVEFGQQLRQRAAFEDIIRTDQLDRVRSSLRTSASARGLQASPAQLRQAAINSAVEREVALFNTGLALRERAEQTTSSIRGLSSRQTGLGAAAIRGTAQDLQLATGILALTG